MRNKILSIIAFAGCMAVSAQETCFIKGHIADNQLGDGKAVKKGGKTCVLLGEKVNKKTGKTEEGINTWVAIENLSLVGKTTTTTSTPAYTTYTVKEDDTLWDIAKYCGSTVSAIQRLNRLESEPEENRLLLIPVV